MVQLRHDLRQLIRRLFFAEHLAMSSIADRLGLDPSTVRRAIVIDGDARGRRRPGPFCKESDA